MQSTTPKYKFRRALPRILCTAVLFIGFLCFFSGRWYVGSFGRLGFDSVLYTLTSDLGGVQSGQITGWLLKGFLPAVLLTVLAGRLLLWPSRKGKYEAGMPLRKSSILLSVLLALGLTVFAAFDVELVEYLFHQNADSRLYETAYVDPDETKITFPEKKRNLIYIMLESMETTYLSEELGGAMEENLIPELHQLAEENLTFYTPDPGSSYGYYTTSGTTWTIGSMVAQTAGIPLKTPTEDVNQYGSSGEEFLPGVTTLNNILAAADYTQVLMVGSDARFGGRKAYFEQHNVTEVLDFYAARAQGYIPKDYFVWWGMEDQKLFSYAQQTILNLAANAEPFAFTMLTVDTHHVGGYQCELCQPSASGETYDQSISCSSRQVADFIDWLRHQDFYEDTTVIIVGDHESMDNGYMERNVDKDYQRLLYNCFINTAVGTDHAEKRRFCAMDLFPTTLAAIGCTIEGERLGLGTNLFSGEQTLIEQYGFQRFNEEIAKASSYYEEHFWK